jgi:hypothetical protein
MQDHGTAILIALLAVALLGAWIRVRLTGGRFNKAFSRSNTRRGMRRTLSRAGSAQRAKAAFRKVMAICLVLIALRVYLAIHGH